MTGSGPRLGKVELNALKTLKVMRMLVLAESRSTALSAAVANSLERWMQMMQEVLGMLVSKGQE